MNFINSKEREMGWEGNGGHECGIWQSRRWSCCRAGHCCVANGEAVIKMSQLPTIFNLSLFYFL